ncbi:MAG TPA: Hint domain-containing protein [Holophaga sp.]|nr:Hint domain-containing protein [Holophaga sp.]
MQIFVRDLNGKNITLDVEPTDSVQTLEGRIEDKTALAPDLQTIVFSGTKLEVNRTLADYNIQKETTLQLYAFPDMGGFSSTSSGYTGGGGGAGGQGGNAEAACFLEGTLIGTPQGDVPIETLRDGAWVFFIPYARFRNGRSLPSLARVKWVARKRAAPGCRGAARGLASNRSVRMGQGALDGEMPHADLYITGHHQVVVRGDLVPAGNLVDGIGFAWQDPPGSQGLFHLEFDEFGLVIANGVACESFLDVGNRQAFDNAATALDPQPAG